jgi:hypothetical protein
VLLGIGSVFAASPKMAVKWGTGSLKWMEWFCLGGTAFTAY